MVERKRKKVPKERLHRGASRRRLRVRLRIASQSLFLAIFVIFTFFPEVWVGGELLFRLDATSVLMASAAARTWTSAAAFSIALLVVTLAFGRVFCGWMCPLGTLGDVLDTIFRFKTRGEQFHWVKYAILVATTVMASAGFAYVWLFDPMGWASRIVVSLVPGRADAAGLAVVALAFLSLHAAFGRRAFCRVVCPLGAGLGVVARFARFGRRFDREGCIDCDLCTENNRSFAISPLPENYDPMECFQCGECVAVCPTDALGFHFGAGAGRKLVENPGVEIHVPISGLIRSKSGASVVEASAEEESGAPQVGLAGGLMGGHALGRRQALLALGGGAGLAATLGSFSRAQAAPLRPPGSVVEADFLQLCIRCTACIRACPTQTLVPGKLSDGIAGFQAPVLVAREGGCLHGCTECGEACPTGAIGVLPLAEKQRLRLGTAHIDHERCIPWSSERQCVSCSAACPYEAIELLRGEALLEWGDAVARPSIDESLCTGCGLCEAACPVGGRAAVRIRAAQVQEALEEQEVRVFKPSVEGFFILPTD